MSKKIIVAICAMLGLTIILSVYLFRKETDQRLAYIESNIASWTEERNAPVLETVASVTDVDPTLSVSGNAADAKSNGEALAKGLDYLMNLLPKRNASAFSWEYGKIVLSDGSVVDYNRSALSGFVPVEQNDILVNLTAKRDAKDREVALYLATYSGGAFLRSVRLPYGEPYFVEEGVDEVRFSCAYTEKDDVSMSASLLRKVFCVRYRGTEAHGDGSRPVYVAFGDSITVGVIHRYSGEANSHTAWSYPEYIGEILELETYNKGRGTTGFLARSGGKAPNYMDSVYLNDELLSKASLITIMVGYGNDNLAGLPIGEWDDYYPYDEAGCFYVSGDTAGNKKSIETMLDGGATLFGCMNWAIKWIGEHYPQAELIVIFGAPGKNANLTAVVEGNTGDPEAGTRGHAPQKIVTAVSESDDEISDKLEKLQTALNIPIIDLHREGLPYSYYSSYSQNEDGTYALFSTKGTPEDPVWNSHPSEEGYLLYARYLAGRISDYFMH